MPSQSANKHISHHLSTFRFASSLGYYHPMFLRNSRMFVRNIVRTKVKNTGPRKAASPDEEPDFYRMPRLPTVDSVARIRSKLDTATATETLPYLALPNSSVLGANVSEAQSSVGSDLSVNQALARQLLQQQYGGKSVESASVSTSRMKSDLNRNKVLVRTLLQQQLQKLESLARLPKASAPVSQSSPVLRASLPVSPRPSWLLGSASPTTIPELVPSNTRSNLTSLAQLSERERLAALLSSVTLPGANQSRTASTHSQNVSEVLFQRSTFPGLLKPNNGRFLNKSLH